MIKKHHPNAELLIELLQTLGIQSQISPTGNIANEKN
jgi:hypothetical protein